MERADLMKDTIRFYDKESSIYKKKRYPDKITSYTQYIFKKRLNLFLTLLMSIKDEVPEGASILEIGCADGVVLSKVESKFPNMFSKIVGTDISQGMIEQAKKDNNNPNASFYLRDNLPQEKFDMILELGVHVYDLEDEIRYINLYSKDNSYLFYSCAGQKSLFSKFKLKGNLYAEGYKSYKDNEIILKDKFYLKAHVPYGLFVPKLWMFPWLGRLLQPIFDFVFQKITPELFHEKIYLLQNNIQEPKP